jgi:RNA polymerase sigma factor (sigma-70 family)
LGKNILSPFGSVGHSYGDTITTRAMSAEVFNDAELVSECLSGNRDAFGQIVARHQSLVCSLAYSATGSLSQSEDLAQETFLTAWKQLADLREPEKLRAWLCGIARNLINNFLRHQGREPSHAAEPLETAEEPPSLDPLPPEQAIGREEEAILWRSLEHIPEIYREPLVLFYREHQSVEAVAQGLELSEDAVKQRLSRGRKLLHEQVLAFVEGALERTNPDRAFTAGVLAALPALAATAKSATAGVTAAKSGTAIKMLFMTKTATTLIVAAIAVAAVTTPVVLHHYRTSISGSTSGIHIRGQLRTFPGDNFSAIMPDAEPVTIELWKESGPKPKWRVEKPGRVVVMDGKSTVLYIKPPANMGNKIPQASESAFDTDWLQRIARLSNAITNEIRMARAKGWKVELTDETGADGRDKSVVTIETKSGLADNDFLKNKSFDSSDLRGVYRFDAVTKRLESAQVYLLGKPDAEPIFETSQIDYGQAIDPALFHLDLPANVSWYKEPQKLPDNEKYASMTAEQAARAFFEACANEDWNEAEKFMSPITPELKKHLGGLEIVSLGESFAGNGFGGRFVPYEIKPRPQEFNVRVSNANPAKRCVVTGFYDDQLKLQEDFKWSGTPEVLTNNDVYAQLSPSEAVKAYFDAQSKFDWIEMRKFTSEFDVEETRRQMEAADKQGMDIHKLMPTFEVGEAVWSAKESAWFVKCQALQIKKWNLAVRKDNPAGRWQVGGGI